MFNKAETRAVGRPFNCGQIAQSLCHLTLKHSSGRYLASPCGQQQVSVTLEDVSHLSVYCDVNLTSLWTVTLVLQEFPVHGRA